MMINTNTRDRWDTIILPHHDQSVNERRCVVRGHSTFERAACLSVD